MVLGSVGLGVLGRIADAVNAEQIPFDSPVGWVVLLMVGAAVVAGPWVLMLGVGRVRKGYRLFSTEPVGAGEVAAEQGVVEVQGTARALGETLSGRFSDRPAVAQSWHRERREESTDSEGTKQVSWRTVDRGSDAVPFVVEDKTGRVAVDPSGAEISITQSPVRKGGVMQDEEDLPYRENEGRIEPGDEVFVHGKRRMAKSVEAAPGEDRVFIRPGDEDFIVSDSGAMGTALSVGGFGVFLTAMALAWIPLSIVVFLALLEAATGVPFASWLP